MGSHRVGHDWSDLVAAAAATFYYGGFSGISAIKNPSANAGDTDDLLEEEMATHYSTLAWEARWATIHTVAESDIPEHTYTAYYYGIRREWVY